MTKKLLLLLTLVSASSSGFAAVRGTIMSVAGSPVAQARVSALARESSESREQRLLSDNPARTPLGSATTELAGNFTIDLKKLAGAVEVLIDAAGYEPVAVLAAAEDDLGAVALRPAAPVSGVVTAAGKPVANARLLFTAWGAATTEYLAVTDAEGRYSAPDPRAWASAGYVRHPDFAELVLTGFARRPAMDFQLVPGRPITGSVVAEDGKTAVGGARVFAGGKHAKTEEDGSFTIAHGSSSPGAIRVRDASRAALQSPGPSAALIRLARGATISGVARDGKTQRPLAGARVSVDVGGESEWVISDPSGAFVLRNLPPGRYPLVISYPNYAFAPAEADLRAGSSVEKNLSAMENATVIGTVLDEAKKVVSAARITVAPREESIRPPFTPFGRRQTVSGPDGRYVLKNVPPDQQIDVSARRRGAPAGSAGPLKLASGEVKRGVSIVLPRGITVTGRVLGTDGNPLAGVRVVPALHDDSTDSGMRRMIMRQSEEPSENIETTGEGTFDLQLKQGSYDLAFRREGYAPKSLRGYSVTSDPAPIEITLEPGVEVRGRVVRKDGSGVPDVSVGTMMNERGGDAAPARTAPDGSFVITSLRPGPVMLIAIKQDDFIREMRNVTAPATDLVIEISPGSRLEGRVVEKGSRRPITQFRAGITGLQGSGMTYRFAPVMKAFNAEDGTFVLEHVPVGRADLLVQAPGYVNRRVAGLTLEEGKPLKDLEVELETGVRLFGRVTGPDGSPLSGVSIYPEVERSPAMMVMGPSRTSTDGSGEYAIESLESGEKTIVFNRNGYTVERKTVKLSGKETRLDARLERGREITGTVASESGGPVADAIVTARSGGQDAGTRNTRTDANGAFRFEGLAPGRYTFRASKSGYVAGEVKDIDLDAVAAGVRLTLGGGGTIYGRVLGLPESELGAVMVSATSPGGGANGSVDSSGSYRLEGVPTGSARVAATVRTPGGMRTTQPRTVEVTAGAGVQLDLEFSSDIIVRGRVSRQGRPVGNGWLLFAPRDARVQTRANVATDPNGNYEVSGLAAGTYLVRVSDFSLSSAFETEYEVTGSATFDIEIRGAEIRGRVIDADTGEPIGEASVMLTRAEANAGFMNNPGAETDPAGRFSFENVTAGTYRLRAQKTRYGQAVVDFTVSESDSREIELKLARTEGLRLRVVDARDGRALSAGVWVRDQQGRTAFEGSPAANSEGVMMIPLAPGAYKISVAVQGYAVRSLAVVVPSQEIRVGLSPGGSISIHSGKSAREVARLMTPSGDVYQRGPRSRPQVVIDPGANLIENLLPGPYVMQLLDERGNVKASYPVSVVEGQLARLEI